MIKRRYKINFLVVIGFLLFAVSSNGQAEIEDGHIRIAMRMIGDEVLNDSGDCTSRVLPIEKDGNQYRISFESDFQFNPEILISTIQSVFVQTKIAESYMVQVEACTSKKIVYAYEIRNIDYPDMLPCTTRPQPKGCYNLLINIITPMTVWDIAHADRSEGIAINKGASHPLKPFALLIPLLGLVACLFYFRKKKQDSVSTDPNMIAIGAYRFDKINMALLFKNEKVELTGKEADLLSLLHTSANNALEREVILKNVWGDDGDYVGRTLDVFISKLRKKLDADNSIKIVNIRGVGYKLVINS